MHLEKTIESHVLLDWFGTLRQKVSRPARRFHPLCSRTYRKPSRQISRAELWSSTFGILCGAVAYTSLPKLDRRAWSRNRRLHRSTMFGIINYKTVYPNNKEQLVEYLARDNVSPKNRKWMSKNLADIYDKEFSRNGKRGRWQTVLSLLEEMPRTQAVQNASTFAAAIKACHFTETKWMHALQFLECFRRSAVTPTHEAYNRILQVLKKSPRTWNAAFDLLDEMRRHRLPPNSKTYSSILDICRNGHSWEAAVAFLEEMDAQGLERKSPHFNKVMDACLLAGRMDRFDDVADLAAEEGIEISLDESFMGQR